MVPPPYTVQITFGRPKALFNGRIGIYKAYSDSVGQCLDVVVHCVRQHVVGVPHWAYFDIAIIKADFEMKYTLFN